VSYKSEKGEGFCYIIQIKIFKVLVMGNNEEGKSSKPEKSSSPATPVS
jgi:hypothetical protein